MARIHRVRPPDKIPEASLADIAFLLLIFFISTTTLSEEFGLSLTLPRKSKGVQSLRVNRANVLVISTDPSGRQYLVDDVPTDLRSIREIVRERQAADEKLVVSVEPSRQAPYRAVVDILDELKLAGASRISLKTRMR